MPFENITAKTGKAPIKKLGHTSTDKYGRNPRKTAPNRTVREEKAGK